MRKVIMFNMVTLDGYFEGPDGNIDWHQVDEEFNTFAVEQLATAGGLIFGRVTYQLMESYWPTTAAIQDDPTVANWMNTLPKFVFSRTLPVVGWNNSRLVSGPAEDELRVLKQQPGADLFIFGSAGLSASLSQHRLIDEYRLMLNPVAIGSGRTLFENVDPPLHFRLLKTRPFSNGNILLYYQSANP